MADYGYAATPRYLTDGISRNMQIQADGVALRHRLTVEDYYRMGEAGVFREGERVELIEGDIIDMAPIGSRHAGALKRLAKLFGDAVRDNAIVSIQDPVRLDRHSEPQPDLALLLPRQDFYSSGHPQPRDIILIVEVAEASIAYDRDVKVPLYARHGVPEVWLVDLAARAVWVYRHPSAGAYMEVFVADTQRPLAPALLPKAAIDLSATVC